MRDDTGAAVPTPPRLDALTGIRGVAAWLVVFYHVRFSFLTLFPAEAVTALGKGYLAVDLFFVLSGFVLWFNYGEKLRSGGLQQAWPFLWRRFTRVWPLHGFILLLFVIFAALLVMRGTPNVRYPFDELLLHVLLIQNWGFTEYLRWNDPAWSISTEFAAYLAFPFIAVAVRWERLSAPVLIGIGLVVCAALALLFELAGAEKLGDDVPRLGLWRCLGQFTLGIVACLLWRKWHGRAHAALLALLVCLFLLAIRIGTGLAEYYFLPAALTAGILALALDRGIVARVLSSRPAVYLGEISFSTYLSHLLLFIVFKLAFVGPDVQAGWWGLAGYVAMLALVSAVLYHFVEKPAQRWLNRYQPGRARVQRLAPAE